MVHTSPRPMMPHWIIGGRMLEDAREVVVVVVEEEDMKM